MVTMTRIAILVFALAVVLGPLYTVDTYSVISNLISELGAQHTKNNYIMVGAFIVLGVGVLFDGLKKYHVSLLPFILFGLLMAVVGVFPHKPLNHFLNFNQMYHNLHGIIAGVAGTIITIGFIWQGLRNKRFSRIVCLYLAGVCFLFPILMLFFPSYQGIIQRGMYVQVFTWMWVKYPNNLVNKKKTDNL